MTVMRSARYVNDVITFYDLPPKRNNLCRQLLINNYMNNGFVGLIQFVDCSYELRIGVKIFEWY